VVYRNGLLNHRICAL